jgi:hypothetical protein
MQPAPSRPLQEKRELALPRSNTDPQHSEQLKAGYRDWDQRYSWTQGTTGLSEYRRLLKTRNMFGHSGGEEKISVFARKFSNRR